MPRRDDTEDTQKSFDPLDDTMLSSAHLSRRKLLGLAGGAVLGASAVGGFADSLASAATRRSTAAESLTLAVFQEPDHLDPATTQLITTYQILQSMFDQLIYQVPGRGYFPGLAKSYKVSPDARTYTFKLRSDVTFHDGTQFDANAVKANFDRIVNPKTKSGTALGILGQYKETRVVDKYTVQVVFKVPNASFVNEMTSQPFGISSPTAIAKYGANYHRHPVGTGPFMFKEWITGQHVTVVRNPQYKWGPTFLGRTGPPLLSQVVFRILPDHSAQANALQTGEIQMAQNLNPQDVESILQNKKFKRTYAVATGCPYGMFLNNQKAPTDDVRVRQALNYAVNQDAIIKSLFFGLYTAADSVFDVGTPGYDAATQAIYKYNPQKAGQILDAAGWKMSGGTREKNGQKLSVSILNIANFGFDGIAQLMQAQFKAVGIDAPISDEAFPTVFSTYNKGTQNLANFFFYDVDPFFTASIYGCNFIKSGLNWSHFCNKPLEAQIARANAISNTAKRTAAWKRVGAQLMKQAPFIPVYNKRGVFVGPASMKGLVFTMNTAPMFNATTF